MKKTKNLIILAIVLIIIGSCLLVVYQINDFRTQEKIAEEWIYKNGGSLNRDSFRFYIDLIYGDSITKVHLSSSPIQNINALEKLYHLKSLHLYRTKITSIEPIKNLIHIEFLILAETQIKDIQPLQHLKNLKVLNLNNTNINNIESLKNLKQITNLHLCHTLVTDLSPLYNLKNLKELDIFSDLISKEQIETLQSHLPNCQITY